MGLFDFLKEVPLSAVLKERVELAEQRFRIQSDEKERLLKENGELRLRLAELEKELERSKPASDSSKKDGLSDDSIRVLVFLFRAPPERNNEVSVASAFNMEHGVARYHLDELAKRDLARLGSVNMNTGQKNWGLTAAGRRKVVEEGMLSSKQ